MTRRFVSLFSGVCGHATATQCPPVAHLIGETINRMENTDTATATNSPPSPSPTRRPPMRGHTIYRVTVDPTPKPHEPEPTWAELFDHYQAPLLGYYAGSQKWTRLFLRSSADSVAVYTQNGVPCAIVPSLDVCPSENKYTILGPIILPNAEGGAE